MLTMGALLWQAPSAGAATLPAELDLALERAAAQVDTAALAGVAIGAVATKPELATAILARVAELAPDRAEQTRAALSQAFPDLLPPGEALPPPPPPEPTPAHAPPVAPEAPEWSGKIRLGGAADFGRTERQTLALGFEARNEHDRWRHDIDADIDFIRNDADTLQRDIEASAQSRYTFNTRWFSFGRLKYEDERPSPFRFRTTEIVGLGYRVIDRDNLTLDIQAGPGLRQTEIAASNEIINEGIALLASELSARLSDTARFTNDNELTVGTERTTLESKAAIAISVIWSIETELSVSLKHDTNLPGEEANTDVKTAIALVYGF
jgi:putative salt-induced outer membrane protein